MKESTFSKLLTEAFSSAWGFLEFLNAISYLGLRNVFIFLLTIHLAQLMFELFYPFSIWSFLSLLYQVGLFSIRTFSPFLFGLLYPFSIWTFFPFSIWTFNFLFYLDFYFLLYFGHLFPYLFYFPFYFSFFYFPLYFPLFSI